MLQKGNDESKRHPSLQKIMGKKRYLPVTLITQNTHDCCHSRPGFQHRARSLPLTSLPAQSLSDNFDGWYRDEAPGFIFIGPSRNTPWKCSGFEILTVDPDRGDPPYT